MKRSQPEPKGVSTQVGNASAFVASAPPPLALNLAQPEKSEDQIFLDDPEVDKAKDDPKALEEIWKKRVAAFRVDAAESFVKRADTVSPATLATLSKAHGEEKHVTEEYLKGRSEKLAEFLGPMENATTKLKIGLALSGGGMRACYESIGCLAGLEEIGLLQGIPYAAAVSGSTWALWAYHVSQFRSFRELALVAVAADVRTHLSRERVNHDLKTKTSDYGFIDFYAIALASIIRSLANRPTSSDPKDATETTLKDFIRISKSFHDKDHTPFPIATFISDSDPNINHLDATWHEVTPLAINIAGPKDKPGTVTTTLTGAFGARFQDPGADGSRQIVGVPLSQDDVAFLMAICGSAFAASLKELIPYSPPILAAPLLAISRRLGWDTAFLVNPEIDDIRVTKNGKPVAEGEKVSVRDAGMSLNFPLVPLLRRDCNVIIVKDVSFETVPGSPNKNPRTGAELLKSVEWVEAWKDYFGTPSYPSEAIKEALEGGKELEDKVYHFASTDKKRHVIYIPRLTNTGTLQFVYSSAEKFSAISGNHKLILDQQAQLKKILRRIAMGTPEE